MPPMAELINQFAGTVARLAEDVMPDLCHILTASADVRDARGGIHPGEPNEGKPLGCRVDIYKAGVERVIAGTVRSITLYMVRVMALREDGETPVIITSDDSIRVLPRGAIPERLMSVESVMPREGVMINVVCTQVSD